jgi:starch synthase
LLHIGFLTAEAVPYAKVGGLADVSGALPRELERQGARVTVVLPAYRSIERERWGLRRAPAEAGRGVTVGGRREAWSLERAVLPDSNVEVLCIGGRYFDRDGIYNDAHSGRDFEDQLERWVFFCRAALAALGERGQPIDVLHLNDHHTALAAAYRDTAGGAVGAAATFFSIHNLGYQGLFRPQAFALTGLPGHYMDPMGALEFWGAVNLMKGGLVLADALGTVSPTYAREIQSGPDFGHGLEGVLRSRSRDLVGILNGIDTAGWNPASDPHLAAPYDRDRLAGKERCKRALLDELQLPFDARTPVFASIGRLTAQKGIDLLLATLPALVAAGAQVVVLGSGDPDLQARLAEVARRAPRHVAIRLDFDNALAHRIEAGADFFLMPSRYEPCGLNQMYSLRYGTPPLVRRTGGLADTVRDWDPATGSGNGFAFGPYHPDALAAAIRRALAVFRDGRALEQLRRAGMQEDFSWTTPAHRYLAAYRGAIDRCRARPRTGGARI